jgi:hypothetical protein
MILILIPILGVLGFLTFLLVQRVAIMYAKKSKYLTDLPEDGTYVVIWRGNEISQILYNPPQGWGVYIKGRTHVILTPELITALKNADNPDLKSIGVSVLGEFVVRENGFDFGVKWNSLQRFFKNLANVYFMGFEEYNVEKFQIQVEKHKPAEINKETGTPQILSTQKEMIPSEESSLVRIVFDHQMVTQGRQLAGLGYKLPGMKTDTDMPGAFSIGIAANVVLYGCKPLLFIALAKENALDIGDKVNTLLETKFLEYSQAKTYKEVVEELKEEKGKGMGQGTGNPKDLFSILTSINGFDVTNEDSLRILLELDDANANGEKLPDSTGLALFRYDIPDFYLEQAEILKTMRIQQENIVKNQAEETNQKGLLKVEKARAPVVEQQALNDYTRNEWEPALDELYANNMEGHTPGVLRVLEYRNLPDSILAYGDGKDPGGIIAIPSDAKKPPSNNPQSSQSIQANQKFKKRDFKKKNPGKNSKKPNSSQP